MPAALKWSGAETPQFHRRHSGARASANPESRANYF
jgi:hypothetical protein